MPPIRERHPVPPARPAYWCCQVFGWGAWCVLGMIIAHRQARTLGADVVVGYGLFFGYSIGLTHLARRIIRLRGWLGLSPWWMFVRLAGLVVVLGPLLTALVILVSFIATRGDSGLGNMAAVFYLAMNLTVGAAAWVVLYASLSSWMYSREARQRAEKMERNFAAARLKALEAQISPHFLFNCLNSLRGMIAENPVHAQDMVTRLANILRHNLTRGTEAATETLEQQVEVVSDYLKLESVRFDERLRTRITIDPAVGSCAVPSMLLQTLVENAIKHGIATLSDGGEITIDARAQDDAIIIAVENSGELRPSPPGSTRVGLANLRERLRMLHGPTATCELRTVAAQRVRAEVRLPLSPSAMAAMPVLVPEPRTN